MKKFLYISTFTLVFTFFCQPLAAQSGNVGIGTANPQAKLHVAGDMQVDNKLVLKDSLDNDRFIIDPDNALFQMLDANGNVIYNFSIDDEGQNANKGSLSNSIDGMPPIVNWNFDPSTQMMSQSYDFLSGMMSQSFDFESGMAHELLHAVGFSSSIHKDENGAKRQEEIITPDQFDQIYYDEIGNTIADHIVNYENGIGSETWKFHGSTDPTPKLVVKKDEDGINLKKPETGDELHLNETGVHTKNTVTLIEFFADCFGLSKLGPNQFVGMSFDLENGKIILEGDLEIQGNISKSGGTFKIDHPEDPTNKWLYHSFVESPDRMNVYNGNITTNSDGEALVELPGYFDDLNKDFRYQLTVIGTFAQAIISEEVQNKNFKIKTSQPNVKVSWQVTGIRQDEFAKDNPIEVEAPKTGWDKGKRSYDPNRKLPYSKGLQNHWERHLTEQKGSNTED